MNHAIKDFADRLGDARKRKGISQRKLSALSGVPQSHISKIEKGGVDLRVSSLMAISRALDLELTLVPRKALPAVKAIANSSTAAEASSPKVHREFDHLADAIKSANAVLQSPTLRDALSRFHEFERHKSQVIDLDELRNLRKALERAEKSRDLRSAEDAAKRLRLLRNRLAHSVSATEHGNAPRPAYRLEEDDD